ncbi:MAG: histidine kinase dimerization/phosphoacceptor domain -containing protein [Pseudomonadota bacterium]
MDISSEQSVSKDRITTSMGAEVTDLRWWNTVRTRFTLLLTLALLPWLLLTALEALSTLDRDRESQARLADMVAANAVGEVGRTLEAGRFGLEAAPQLIAERGCETGAVEVLERLGIFTALIVEDQQDGVICQSPASLPNLMLIEPGDFGVERNFRIERGRLGSVGENDAVVVLQTFFQSLGRTYTLIMPTDLGLTDVLNVALGDGAAIALTKPSGKGIVGVDTPEERRQAFRTSVSSDDVTLMNYVSPAGEDRRVAVQFFPYLDIYVTVGRYLRHEQEFRLINPLTSVLLPIIAWLVGFGLIWLGTQTMLLTPIAKIRRTSRQFASGRLGTRVDLSSSAAAEVQGLARSLNSMARQLQERDGRIADNIDEKDTLMREIHHRVKNNLQIIISLLNMQERKAESEEAIGAIAETRARINAIAIVYRGLYESDDLRGVDLEPFVSRLISALSDSLGTEEAGISLSHAVDGAVVSADNAIPVALFIVEAVSNAVKHGVERGGSVDVRIAQLGDARLQIDVCDNGKGVGDPASMRGIGTRLMHGFARQLSGTLEFVDNAPGLTARLTLPLSPIGMEPFQVSRKRR